MRIFLDANILFSAAKSDGAVRHFLKSLLVAGHACCADGYVVAEARRNLHAKGSEALTELDLLLRKLTIADPVAQPRASRAELDWLPDKDRPVLAAAIRLRCDALVTGDRRHFGAGYGKTFEGVTVHSPRSLAQQLNLV